MRVLVQRVNQAKVTVADEVVGEIQVGLLLLVGFATHDNSSVLKPMIDKLINLRVFPSEQSHFDQSLLQIGGGALLVPQFTLYADPARGRRPDFGKALRPEPANDLFQQFVKLFRESGVAQVATGSFGAHMQVALENDGPVTILVEIDPS